MDVTNPIQAIQGQFTLKDVVYERILRAICSGRLHPGTKITIANMAEQLNVSMMPVREAIRKLEAGKLISVKKNRRITINKFYPKQFKELLEIRLNLECMAAKKAAKNSNEGIVKELKQLLYLMGRAKDIEEYLLKNKKFHHTIYQNANMPILLEVINDLWLRASPYIHLYVANDLNYRPVSCRFHEGMLRGMRNKNPGEVAKWLRSDLRGAAKKIIEIIEQESFTD